MLESLGREIEKLGGHFEVHTQSDGHMLMVVEFPEADEGDMSGMVARVKGPAGLDTGAKWLVGQLITRGLEDTADWFADEAVEVKAGRCGACGGAVAETAVAHELTDSPIQEGAVSEQLTGIAVALDDGEITLDEAASELARLTLQLAVSCGVASEPRTAADLLRDHGRHGRGDGPAGPSPRK